MTWVSKDFTVKHFLSEAAWHLTKFSGQRIILIHLNFKENSLVPPWGKLLGRLVWFGFLDVGLGFFCICSPDYPHLLYFFQQNKFITLFFWEYIYSWDLLKSVWKRCDFTHILPLSFKETLTNCVFNPFSRYVWSKMKE